jgi:hypothetical protein
MNRKQIVMTGIPAWLVLVSAFSVALSNGALSESSTPIEIRTVDEQEIHVVVVRHQMERWIRNAEESEAAAKEEWGEVVGKEHELPGLFRLDQRQRSERHLSPPLARYSKKDRKASNGQVTMHGVLDKETHQAGIIFNVADIRWFSGDAAEVHGGYWCGGRCGASILFRVQRENSKGVVKDLEMQGISLDCSTFRSAKVLLCASAIEDTDRPWSFGNSIQPLPTLKPRKCGLFV